jgi:hypothetical protein
MHEVFEADRDLAVIGALRLFASRLDRGVRDAELSITVKMYAGFLFKPDALKRYCVAERDAWSKLHSVRALLTSQSCRR